MICQWENLLAILPGWMKADVDRLGRTDLQALRLRIHQPPELERASGSVWLNRSVKQEDLQFCINAASKYSPWAAASIAQGFLTAPGGHRIGLCGETVTQNGTVTGIRNPTSLHIRIARDYPGIAENLPTDESMVIIGSPGWGKTTLLRDLIRRDANAGCHICVVDARGELFPSGIDPGRRTDVMTGCSKSQGIPMLLRTMGPDCIAMDEITEEGDCMALLQAFGCGVRLLATAHASSMENFRSRRVYEPLIQNRVFQTAIILRRDKSWHYERMA